MKQTTMAIAVFSLLLVAIFTGCSTDNTGNTTASTDEIYTIRQAGSFSKETCEAKSLNNKVLMIESKYCGHCQATKPEFKQALEETNMTAEYIDVSIKEEMEALKKEHKLQIQYTPTFVFGCDYYVGAKDKEGYVHLLENMKNQK
ncbi:MAG: thioredoxin family protein [Nanobdellota archaeon]